MRSTVRRGPAAALPFRLIPFVLAAALAPVPAPSQTPAPTQTGADVLAADGCLALRGRQVGLVTNHTGRTSDGRRVVDVIAAAEGVTLVTLFSPEHGWEGAVDEKVGDSRDAATGLRVWSLYGETRRPTATMLAGVDTLVFDIQDIGCRFYTYVSTLRNCLEAAAEHGQRVVVLDRPNPLGGLAMAGPVLADERRDFVGAHRVPVRHGMTAGELARMMVGEDGIGCELQVIACRGWQRADLWADTGLPWINPSPNMRTVTAALLYPGIGLLEGTNLSVGRGTDTPFEVLGAPWCDGVRLAAALRAARLPGVAFVPVSFTPTASRFRGERCGGVHFVVTDWRSFEPLRLGITVATVLRRHHPDAWQLDKLDWLLKHAPTAERIRDGAEVDGIVAAWQPDLQLFRRRRQPFLLYE
ncbi:MAG: DUF1343 domain-containing protein [Planctomycetes bacterium]|nr:DUF1343 domain-containing protein [Planctomycetota bacterium]